MAGYIPGHPCSSSRRQERGCPAKAGHDGFGAVISPKTAEKSLHFLVILSLWG
jgi:hypothetical protein